MVSLERGVFRLDGVGASVEYRLVASSGELVCTMHFPKEAVSSHLEARLERFLDSLDPPPTGPGITSIYATLPALLLLSPLAA